MDVPGFSRQSWSYCPATPGETLVVCWDMPVNATVSADRPSQHPLPTVGAAEWVDDGPVRNRVLGSLRARDLAAIRPHLTTGRLREHGVLWHAERQVQHVYFPESAIVSLHSIQNNRAMAVGTVGAEGMVGLGVFLGESVSCVRATVEVSGIARRMKATTFRRLVRKHVGFREAMLSYTRSFIADLNQRVTCGSAHLVEDRCARWLLTTSDRVGAVNFPLTLEFLALMVGVRRGGVAVGMRTLQDRNLIHYDHGRVHIVDRSGLERVTCNCYNSVPVAVRALAVS